MGLPFASLNAAPTVAVGTARDLEDLSGHHTMIVASTGSPSRTVVSLEGSHDGSTWTQIAAVDFAGAGPAIATATDVVRHVRANLSTLTGGTSPTVTATIASEEED
jgi:hypothetical protein